MVTKTVAGPFTKEEAEATARQLGCQYSAYGVYRKDADGYTTEECDYYVERDDTIPPDKIFGYDAKEFLRRQYK